MVLSFFGKKSQAGGKDGNSPSATEPRKSELTTSLDFSHVAGDVGRALADAAGKIQVQEVTDEDVAVIEEAAILYANANEDGARAVLEQTIDSGAQSERLWAMLFDLYRLTGDKASFDARGVAYAQAYEKSPPVWQGQTPAAAAPQRDGAPAVNLTGMLSGGARTQFEQLVRIGVKMGKLRMDLSRLRGVDGSGCTLLRDTLDSLKQGKVRLQVLGAQHAISLLEHRLKVGVAEDQECWQVVLMLMLHTGDQERFEDMAVNYAITFEESPPSWDPSLAALTETTGIVPPAPEEHARSELDGFVLDGAICGSQPEIFRKLAIYASERHSIEIDASALRRLEFVSAGALFNQLAILQGQGKLSVIRQPNELVAALMRVMGIDQVAQIEYRKF